MTRNDDQTNPWKMTKAMTESTRKSCVAIPKTNVRYVWRSPGTVSKWIQPHTRGNVIAAASTDEVNLVDLVKFGQGNRFSLESLRPEYSKVDLTRYDSFRVPVIFLLGRHDWHVPSVLAERYFDAVSAPRKRLVWFEQSAHNPPFEEPERFVRVVTREVLPLASGRLSPCVTRPGGVARAKRPRMNQVRQRCVRTSERNQEFSQAGAMQSRSMGHRGRACRSST